MAITIALMLCFVLVSLVDIPELRRKKRKRELYVYTALLVIAFILFDLHFLHIKMWGLNHFVAAIVNWFVP